MGAAMDESDYLKALMEYQACLKEAEAGQEMASMVYWASMEQDWIVLRRVSMTDLVLRERAAVGRWTACMVCAVL